MSISVDLLLVILCFLTLLLIAAAAAILWLAKNAMPKPTETSGLTENEPEAVPVRESPYDDQLLRSRISKDMDHAESELRSTANDRARRVILESISRLAAPLASNSTSDFVAIESEDVKGRIIGRDGRNIRAFEEATGVDLLVDEQPGAVLLSCFDPMRRAIGKRTLESLVADGRIQPARIEEEFAKAKREIEKEIDDFGRSAAKEAKVDGLEPRVLTLLGKLRYRASYGQNVLEHSIEVAQIAGILAVELGFDAKVARKSGLLHDIGKALGPETTDPHALSGMKFLKECGIQEPILNCVGAHHHDIMPASPEAELVIVADTISASRPGARSEGLESFLRRMESLEAIARECDGVQDVYAVQSGREVRVIVAPEKLDDLGCRELAATLAARFENASEVPGATVVTVIREYRATRSTKEVQG